NTVTYDVVAFRPDVYRAAMRLGDADVDRFLQVHADDVSAKYKADERTYKGTKPALKLRQIFIAKLAEPKPPAGSRIGAGDAAGRSAAGSAAGSGAAAPEPKKDDKKKDDKKAPEPKKPAGMPIDAAKAKLEAIHTANTKQKFLDGVKDLSTDEASKSVG